MRPSPTSTDCPAPCPTQELSPGTAHAAFPAAGAAGSGCSGEGAASAMRQWLRQHEERERVKDLTLRAHPPLA